MPKLKQRLREYVAGCFTGIWVETQEPQEASSDIQSLCQEEAYRFAHLRVLIRHRVDDRRTVLVEDLPVEPGGHARCVTRRHGYHDWIDTGAVEAKSSADLAG